MHFFSIIQTSKHIHIHTHNVELFANYEIFRVSAFMLRGFIEFIEFISNGRSTASSSMRHFSPPTKKDQQNFILCMRVRG